MRKWRSPEVPVDDEWAVNHRIVVPKIYRSEILSLAHETPMSDHLGVTRPIIRLWLSVCFIRFVFLVRSCCIW